MIPREQGRLISWYRDLGFHVTGEGLEHTLDEDERRGPVRVISSTHNELFFEHPERVIDDHTRAWNIIRVAVAGTELQERLVSCSTVAEAWTAVQSWVLPTTSAETRLLEAELANAEYPSGGPPKLFFARIDSVVNKLKLVGVEKISEQILDVMMDKLPSQFGMEKVMLRSNPALTRHLVKETIGDAYATARREKILKQPAAAPAPPAAPSDPYAFCVGGFQSGRGRGGGGGFRRRGRGFQGNCVFGYGGTGGSGRPHGQKGLGQQWQQRPLLSMMGPQQHQPLQQMQQY